MSFRFSLVALAAATLACAQPVPELPAPAVPEPSGADTVRLVVAATTDVHGHLRGWDYFAGAPDSLDALARAATIVDSLRRANPGRVVLVDAGDLLQGTPLTYLAARADASGAHPVIAAMTAMRYDAAAVGNHEFNYGVPIFERAARQASFPFLAANVRRMDGTPAFPAYVLTPRGPLSVAIVGATTPGSAVWDRDKLEGKLRFGDVVPAVRQAVAQARADGADVVIVVMHTGLDEPASYDTVATGLPSENVAARVAHEVPGIDLIVYGHSHRQMADTVIAGTRLIQPKNWARSVGIATLTVARDSAGWRVARSRGMLVPTAGHAESPRVVAAVDRAHRAAVAYAADSVGTTATAWSADSARVADTPLIDFILEVERKATGAQLASTAAFSLDASLPAGRITNADVARLYPYENTLKAVKISGRALREYLEMSARYFGRYGTAEPAVDPRIPGFNYDIIAGATYALDLARPAGSRVTRLEVDGKPVAPTDTFTLAVNNYRQSGGGGYAMLRDAPVVYDGQTEIRQLLLDEVKRVGTLRQDAYFTRNWELVPAAAIGPAYAAMHRPWTGGTR